MSEEAKKVEKEKEEIKKQAAKFDLNKYIFWLLKEEPFFASISRRLDKTASTAIPTAGVRVNPDTFQLEMIYNPEWFMKLPIEQIKGVLIHEIYHVIFKHISDRLPAEEFMKVWNVAADLSINCLIGFDKLPDGCCFPGKGPFADFASEQTAEAYFKMILEDPEVKEVCEGSDGEGDGNGNFDSHDWNQTNQDVKELAKERIKEVVGDAVDKCMKTDKWGSISQAMKQKIVASLKSEVNWRKTLRYFIGQAQKTSRTSSIKRINRRFPYIHAGKKPERMANIAISIDQSGSVSQAMLERFFGELNSLSALATFTVIPFDHAVAEDKIYVWKKGQRRPVERVMYGGTCFNAPSQGVRWSYRSDRPLRASSWSVKVQENVDDHKLLQKERWVLNERTNHRSGGCRMLNHSPKDIDEMDRREVIVEGIKQVCCETQERVLEEILSLVKEYNNGDELAEHIIHRLSQDNINLLTYALLTNFPDMKRRAYGCYTGSNINPNKAVWLLKKVLEEEREL
jgi:predicted metal-dependent peptidase